MNDRISDLLAEVADDTDRPLGFIPADLSARGRVVRRRRTTIAAVTGVAAVAAVAVALAVVVPTEQTSGPPAGPATQATDSTSPTPTPTAPVLTAEDERVAEQCTALEAGLAGWSLDAQVTDEEGTTATFVSPDDAQWRQCTLGFPGDEVTGAWPLSTAWDSPDTILAGGGVGFSELCPKDSPPDCSRRLYVTVQPLWDGVASVEVATPRGAQVDAVAGRSTYVVRFAEKGVPESVPVVVATLRDADGETVLRYDYNDRLR